MRHPTAAERAINSKCLSGSTYTKNVHTSWTPDVSSTACEFHSISRCKHGHSAPTGFLFALAETHKTHSYCACASCPCHHMRMSNTQCNHTAEKHVESTKQRNATTPLRSATYKDTCNATTQLNTKNQFLLFSCIHMLPQSKSANSLGSARVILCNFTGQCPFHTLGKTTVNRKTHADRRNCTTLRA